MDIYKLSTTSQSYKRITEENFVKDTDKRYPYYQTGTDGVERHYAVCPACNNPIQLIGLIVRQGYTKKAYGKHVAKSIKELSSYDKNVYECCPLAAKRKTVITKQSRKPKMDKISHEIINIMRSEFDRVVLVLEEALGIKITENLAGKMFDKYLAEKGYSYRWASLINIPWIFAYMADSQSLIGRKINNEKLKAAIESKMPELVFKDDQLIKKEPKSFVNLNFCFRDHTINPVNGAVQESMTWVVSKPEGYRNILIYTQIIEFDYDRFQSLCNIPDGKGYRKTTLLDLAEAKLSGV